MTGIRESAAGPSGFQVGSLVEVKSKEQILATLDENGELDSLPFMPEMLKYCGKQIRVYRQANKLCDTAEWTGFHRMQGAVHLQDARCSGAAHGGCQAACLLYWKEEWLRPLGGGDTCSLPEGGLATEPRRGTSELELTAATRTGDPDCAPSDAPYRCQATELVRAASAPIHWWDMSAYWRDVRSGNAQLLPMLRSILVMLFNKFQRANQKFLPRLPLIHGAQTYPFISGSLRQTPRQTLGLQAGERVRVKSRAEITATLDSNARNRGLSFDAEMLKYCGREARVLRRVERIIDEHSGRMLRLPNDCIMLEGVVCTGDYNQYCPRSIFPYWREIWLERIDPAEVEVDPVMSRATGLKK